MICDIKSYIDMTYEQKYNENNTWQGQLLLLESGYFEGIVTNKKMSKKEKKNGESFVFGVYYPGQCIKLFKLDPSVSALPHEYDAKITETGYAGNFYEKLLFGEQINGNCKMNINRSSLQESETLAQTELERKLAVWKNTKMSSIDREFYRKILEELKNLTAEDIQTIIARSNPADKNCSESTICIKLFKNMDKLLVPRK